MQDDHLAPHMIVFDQNLLAFGFVVRKLDQGAEARRPGGNH
jgi:hypothetical protein